MKSAGKVYKGGIFATDRDNSTRIGKLSIRGAGRIGFEP